MKKKFLSAFLCVVLAFAMILSVSAEPVSTLINSGDEETVSDIYDDSADAVEETETVIEEPKTTDDGNVIVALTPDYNYGYGLYGGYDGQNSLDDMETAGAAVAWEPITNYSISAPSGLWWIDDYYVGTDNLYYCEETDNFSLKYQVEFHTSEDIEAGNAIITITGVSLSKYRDGTNILPTDIGIVYGTPDNYTAMSSSPFNYYYTDESGNILTIAEAQTYEGKVTMVVWNYRDIDAGSNAVFQVLYSNLDAMQIPDMTEWAINVSAETTVDVDDDGDPTTPAEPTTEPVDGNELTGVLDTAVTLSSVTKRAYTATGKSYTPELYTETQVNNYINGSIPEPYASNFDDYIYIVWDVTLRGSANQAYTITLEDVTNYDGAVVGWKTSTSSGVSFSTQTVTVNNEDGTTSDVLNYVSSQSTNRTYSATVYVVTAYPVSAIEDYGDGTGLNEIKNTVTVTAHPVDEKDEDIVREASAETSWGEYEWHYTAGDIIGVSKSSNGTYSAYWTLYKLNQAKEKDTGSFPFTVKSTNRTYEYTHHISGTNVGEWNGSYCTTETVDDALYFYPNEGTDPSRMLTKEDYYYSSVSITNTSKDYDVWEDTEVSPIQYGDDEHGYVDQSMYVYAMFYYDYDENGNLVKNENDGMSDSDWEYVATVGWNSSGTLTYTFSSEDLARQPYRVKVVHSDANYVTYCTISLSVTLRYDSPIIQEYIESMGNSLENIEIENIGGVSGQLYEWNDSTKKYDYKGYYQDQEKYGVNYSEHDTVTGLTLEKFTEDLYNTLLMRDNAHKYLTSLEETANSYKSASTQNDAANERVLTDYYLTAYEAYYVTGSDSVDTLKEAGLSLPARNDVTYYDLLPYGMKYNGSVQPVAGRITSMNSSGSWRTNTGAWSTSGVSVSVTEDDIIDNWNGTGRTMVVFHIHYDGDDASEFYNVPSSDQDLWYEGFGIYFQAYYDWGDIQSVDAEYNLAVYTVSATDETQQLLGVHDRDVWQDNGEASVSSRYSPVLVSDLNGDGVTDLYTNMYAAAITNTNVATSDTSTIHKSVRADDDVMAEFGSTAVVGNGKGYTYEVSLTNASGDVLSDIVLFDNLENSVEDKREAVETGSGSVFNGLSEDEIENNWKGTFNGLTLTGLYDLDIAPVVYYNESRNATIPDLGDNKNTPADVLTEDKGWYEESAFLATHDISEVKAIAIDISTKSNGSDFTMGALESLSYQIHMIAPEDVPEGYIYAFNNPAWYGVSTASADGTQTHATDMGDTVRVEIGETGELSVEKQISGEIPDAFANANYTFIALRSGVPLANQEYMLYNYDSESGEWVSTGIIRATDINGQFTLKAGQKAVFSNLVDVADVVVNEVENVYFEPTATEVRNSDNDAYYTYTNSYRSPVYLYKTAATTDLASDDELASAKFTFKIEIDTTGDGEYDSPYVGEILYVDSVLTDGTSPTVTGHGTTDENGEITLHIGDIIVFYPVDADGNCLDVSYRITEIAYGEDWICKGTTAGGVTDVYGTASTITNYYKYRALIVSKSLNSYDGTDSFSFTFTLTDESGTPVVGNTYYEVDSKYNYVSEGMLNEYGEFTLTDSNNKIVIVGLVSGEKYTVTETEYDATLFETVNDGSAEVTMPSYSITRNASITNRYLLRDLTVQKVALSSDTSENPNEHEFTYTLTDGNGNAVANAAYTIVDGDGTVYYTDKDGQFTIYGNQSVYFNDIGYVGDVFIITETADTKYPQISPADGQSADITLTDKNTDNTVQFVNGNFDNIVSIQKQIVGLDEVGENYVDWVKANYGKNSLTDSTGEHDGRYYVDVKIGVYDGTTGNRVTSSGGNTVAYGTEPDPYPYAYIKIDGNGNIELLSYNGGEMTVTLYPGDVLYIAELGNCEVRAEETGGIIENSNTDGITDNIYSVAGGVRSEVGSEYILVTDDVRSGSAVSGGAVTLVNDISSAHEESVIYKLMSDTSTEPDEGAELVLRVERYSAPADDESAGTWTPAEGIKYITFDGYEGRDAENESVTNTSAVLTTGSDGTITLVKGETGYPYIRFTEDVVSANIYDTTDLADGTLRIIELLDDSNDAWGRLVGYDSEDWADGPALNITPADTFVNGNDDAYQFEVAKTMSDDESSDADFTFTLTQVISASMSPIESMNDILATTAGNNVYYQVYDSDTDAYVGEGYTSDSGQFTLKAGQYARFYVPTGTTWIVSEGVNAGYTLVGAKSNGTEDTNVIEDGWIGVFGDTTEAYPLATLILTLTDESGNPIEGATFELYKDDEKVTAAGSLVTDKNGQITYIVSVGGDYYFTETDSNGYIMPDPATTDTITVDKLPGTYTFTMTNSLPTINYAVRLYGICADTYSTDGGETTGTASLTFGAAIGKGNLLDSYVSRETVGETNHPSMYCIHDMSWTEIINICEQYKGNETQLKAIFGDCLDNGCTKAVPLTTNDTLFNSTTVDNALSKGYLGDGVSTLYYLLNYSSSPAYAGRWNYSHTGNSTTDRANIYFRSRIRTTLNGDSTTIKGWYNDGEHNNYYDASTDLSGLFTEENCLLSAFPQELQDAIIEKEILPDTDLESNTSYNTTVYDKLWLPSMHELGFSVTYDKTPDVAYTKSDDTTPLFSENSDRIAYEFNGTGAASSSTGLYYWSRSRYSNNNNNAYYVTSSGGNNGNGVSGYCGLSPAFCIG